MQDASPLAATMKPTTLLLIVLLGTPAAATAGTPAVGKAPIQAVATEKPAPPTVIAESSLPVVVGKPPGNHQPYIETTTAIIGTIGMLLLVFRRRVDS